MYRFTGEVLTTTVTQRDLQKRVLTADREFRLRDFRSLQSLKHIAAVPKLSWLKIWDMALDHGARGTKAALSFLKAISRPLFGDRLSPYFNLSIEQDQTYLEHLVQTHQELHLGSVEEITDILVSASPSIICIGRRLLPSSIPPL